jgi:hypothetical protein
LSVGKLHRVMIDGGRWGATDVSCGSRPFGCAPITSGLHPTADMALHRNY